MARAGILRQLAPSIVHQFRSTTLAPRTCKPICKAFSPHPSSRPLPSLRCVNTSSTSQLLHLAKYFKTAATRNITTSNYQAAAGQQGKAVDWTRVIASGCIAATAVVGLNYSLNGETRGGLTQYESAFLNETYRWTAGGLVITASTARFLFKSGAATRIMSTNPWLVMLLGVGAGIGSMLCVYNTAPESPFHVAAYLMFSAVQGVTLSPLFFLNPAVLSRAGLYTCGAVAGLSYVGATAKSDQFLYIGGALLAGLGVLIATSLAPMILPRMSMRTLSTLEHISAYGGTALFSAFILYDTQKILRHSSLAQKGVIARDPVRESVSLVLDIINLFVRIVQVLMLQQSKRK